ncbi:MAG: carbon-nitrogen family hydrolase [Verrucomicrobiae bacterium]|nr:carbon-nitrogen family hydrolase [Verrucomicrobiae bacterium]MCP5516631.1 carbon-nitrogen family hydrolase [Verrucomicrobiales bacterium]MCP5528551.1 carbon-nitrogen family hydrolase [Verrucomicrobiales bacterium]
MKIIGCQWDVAWEDKPANFDRIRALLRQSPPPAGSLVVLPEMFATGFTMDLSVTREALHAPTEEFLESVAREFECLVMGGVVRGGRGGITENQAVVSDPRGRILARFAKLHAFSPAGEERQIQPGRDITLFEWGGFLVCPFICYDLRFPEAFRQAAARGATLFVVLANWPAVRVAHWITLLQARAIENQAYVVGVNRCGADPAVDYPGRSLIIDPRGEILADGGPEEAVVAAELDPKVVEDWREAFPALRDAHLF